MTMTENNAVGSGEQEVFVPSEAWIDAYEAQATDELFEKATRFAASRARQVARAGGRVDDLYVEALVQDAFTDTWTGRLAWDPTRATLEQQVINAICSRSRHDREQAIRRRHVSIDMTTRAEVEVSLASQRSDEAIEHAEYAMSELRMLARDDRDVLQMLDAFEDGAFAKQDVMTLTGLSAKRYRNARGRLAKLVQQLPTELQVRA